MSENFKKHDVIKAIVDGSEAEALKTVGEVLFEAGGKRLLSTRAQQLVRAAITAPAEVTLAMTAPQLLAQGAKLAMQGAEAVGGTLTIQNMARAANAPLANVAAAAATASAVQCRVATGATMAVATGGAAVRAGRAAVLAEGALAASLGTKAATGIIRGGSRVAGPAAVVVTMVEFGFRQSQTKADLAAGRITRSERDVQTGGNVGRAAGGLGGAWAGAMTGTAFFPGVGTLIGGILGSWLGSFAGEELGGDIRRG